MNLCKNCLSKIEGGENLPVYSVGWGAAGVLAAIATGTPVLIPLGLIAGILVDVERCGQCGAAMSETNPLYMPMHGKEDAVGGQTFTPHHVKASPSTS